MTITAKYPGKCGSCGQQISVGQEIEWTRGAPSRHTDCQRAAAAPAPRPGTCQRCGRTVDPRYSLCYRCAHPDEQRRRGESWDSYTERTGRCYRGHSTPQRGCRDCFDEFDC